MTKPTERHFWFSSYLCLYHQWAVHSQIMDDAIHVYNILPLYLEYQTVNGYEGTRASDSSTEWTNNREKPSQIHVVLCLKQFWRHVIWGSGCVCVLRDLQWTTVGECLEYWSMCSLTRCLKPMRSSVVSGTPWSGQAVKWNWRTERVSAVFTWRMNRQSDQV